MFTRRGGLSLFGFEEKKVGLRLFLESIVSFFCNRSKRIFLKFESAYFDLVNSAAFSSQFKLRTSLCKLFGGCKLYRGQLV